MRRGVEVAIGVALGVAVGDLWVWLFGTGVWQIMAVCAIAMSLASPFGAGQLMIIQAGVQSITVTALSPDLGYSVNRWLDAVIGCAIALLIATIAPQTPLRKPTSSIITGCRRPPRRLRALALDSSRVELNDSLDVMVILAQTHSMIVDLDRHGLPRGA